MQRMLQTTMGMEHDCRLGKLRFVLYREGLLEVSLPFRDGLILALGDSNAQMPHTAEQLARMVMGFDSADRGVEAAAQYSEPDPLPHQRKCTHYEVAQISALR